MTRLKQFRITWTPLVRTAGSSAADLVADYLYWDWLVKSPDTNLDKYEIYLFVFFWVSATMCALTFLAIFVKGCCPGTKSKPNIVVRQFNKILALEILLEDIPQFVLTSLITVERGGMTPTGALNFATSGFNFFFNVLEICEPDDDDEDNNDEDNNDEPIVVETVEDGRGRAAVTE